MVRCAGGRSVCRCSVGAAGTPQRMRTWPNMSPSSAGPQPMSPAGMSMRWPMWRHSSVMKDMQKRCTSPVLLPAVGARPAKGGGGAVVGAGAQHAGVAADNPGRERRRTLGVKVGAALAGAHGQCGQRILEALLKPARQGGHSSVITQQFCHSPCAATAPLALSLVEAATCTSQAHPSDLTMDRFRPSLRRRPPCRPRRQTARCQRTRWGRPHIGCTSRHATPPLPAACLPLAAKQPQQHPPCRGRWLRRTAP